MALVSRALVMPRIAMSPLTGSVVLMIVKNEYVSMPKILYEDPVGGCESLETILEVNKISG